MNAEARHHFYLNNLINQLDSVGEKRKDIVSIISEPIWMPGHGIEYHTLCDLILLYDDYSAVACELKGNPNSKHKAKKQIDAGREYIEQVIRYDYRHGLFVVYTPERYIYERIMYHKTYI